MKTESSTNSPTATLAPTKSQRDPVGLQATSPPSHLTGDLRTLFPVEANSRGFNGKRTEHQNAVKEKTAGFPGCIRSGF